MKKFLNIMAVVAAACALFTVVSCGGKITYSPITKEDLSAEWLNGEWKVEASVEANGAVENDECTVIFDVSKNEAVTKTEGKEDKIESIDSVLMSSEMSGMLSLFSMMGAKVEGDTSMMVASDHKSIRFNFSMEMPDSPKTVMNYLFTKK